MEKTKIDNQQQQQQQQQHGTPIPEVQRPSFGATRTQVSSSETQEARKPLVSCQRVSGLEVLINETTTTITTMTASTPTTPTTPTSTIGETDWKKASQDGLTFSPPPSPSSKDEEWMGSAMSKWDRRRSVVEIGKDKSLSSINSSDEKELEKELTTKQRQQSNQPPPGLAPLSPQHHVQKQQQQKVQIEKKKMYEKMSTGDINLLRVQMEDIEDSLS